MPHPSTLWIKNPQGILSDTDAGNGIVVRDNLIIELVPCGA